MASPDAIAGWIVAALATGGGTKYVFDIITARAKGKKTGAEGGAILVSSASEYARGLTERLDKVTEEFDAYRKEQEHYRRQQDALFRQHMNWDYMLRRKLHELDPSVEVPEPPPLYTDA